MEAFRVTDLCVHPLLQALLALLATLKAKLASDMYSLRRMFFVYLVMGIGSSVVGGCCLKRYDSLGNSQWPSSHFF